MNELQILRAKVSHKRVLVVDDEENLLQSLSKFISKIFDVVDIATSGIEALELYHKNAYDIVFTDITMPKMNGWELISKIREDKKKVFIIVLTASETNDYNGEKYYDYYIEKPMPFERLIPVLEAIVKADDE